MLAPEVAKHRAEQAAFYAEADGTLLRMDHTSDDFFACHNEDTGEEYEIRYNAVDGTFWKLIPIA